MEETWSDWVDRNRYWLETVGLPDEVLATEGHWRYFLDHGTLPAAGPRPPFSLNQLNANQMQRLYQLLEYRSPPILSYLRHRLHDAHYQWLHDGRQAARTDCMTEGAWLTTSNPELMLEQLRGEATERKLRLFACACCRRTRLHDKRIRDALDVIERCADGQGSMRKVKAAIATVELEELRASGAARAAARAVATASATPEHSRSAAAEASPNPRTERAEQAELLREIFGNPFRPQPIDAAWLGWNGGCVARISRTIYDEKNFEDMPILADALEEGGCTSEAILTHCRRSRGHVRGCWVLDALLGHSGV
jgi:hypothetical protein